MAATALLRRTQARVAAFLGKGWNDADAAYDDDIVQDYDADNNGDQMLMKGSLPNKNKVYYWVQYQIWLTNPTHKHKQTCSNT